VFRIILFIAHYVSLFGLEGFETLLVHSSPRTKWQLAWSQNLQRNFKLCLTMQGATLGWLDYGEGTTHFCSVFLRGAFND